MMLMIVRTILCCILLLQIFMPESAHTQASNLLGGYYVRNHSKGEYRAQSQNWSIHQDSVSGILYFGNNEGLLSFDGTRWEVHSLPNRMIVRAVFSDQRGKVYVGGYEEFGYFVTTPNGIMEYHSVSALLPFKLSENEEIWHISEDEGRIRFQSFTAIYEYQDGELSVNRSPSFLLYAIPDNDQLQIYAEDFGLTTFLDGSFSLVDDGAFFRQMPVISMMKFKDLEIAGTTLNGLYVKTNGRWSDWDTEASRFVLKNQLNRSIMLNDSTAVLGTIRNGAVIINSSGKILAHLNMDKGLQNNTVLSLFVDMDKNLWIGLDNGISYVQTNSPFRYLTDLSGLLGATYDVARLGDYLYIGTNHGLFYRHLDALKGNESTFLFVDGTQGQVWDLIVKDNHLFCGHNDGTFVIDQPAAAVRKLSSVSGGWSMESIDADWMVQGTYIGLAFYRRSVKGKWEFSHTMDGFNEPVRFVAVRSADVIWASHNQKGVYRIVMGAGYRNATRIDYYGRDNGFPEDYNIHVFKIRDRIVFTTSDGLYTYDELNDSIIPFQKLNRQLNEHRKVIRIVPEGDDLYWLITRDNALLYRVDSDFNLTYQNHFATPRALKIDNYENIISLGDYSCFTLDNGLMLFSNQTVGLNMLKPVRLKLNRVLVSGRNRDDGILLSVDSLVRHKVSASQNNISFWFTNPAYNSLPHQYQVRLHGLESEWSPPHASGLKTYTSLPPGRYEFQVRLSSSPDEPATLFVFEVRPPWFLTRWAFGGYVILVLLLVRVSSLVHRTRLRKHQKEMEKSQSEELERQRMVAEQRIISLEKEKLEAEVMHKSKEISTSALELVSKNRILDELKSEILNIKSNVKGQNVPLNRLVKLIDNNIKQRDDWQLFETNFNHINSTFYEKLSAEYPDLNAKDLRFCAYLKMNLTTKELASLLNMSVRSVELKRYRLRKKLNMKHEDNLIDFLMGLS